jgi:hypothetical protein
MSHVLMVEVDRMNVDAGIIFFCTHFDGEESIPPCSLPYLFFSLYQNHLSDTEQMDIISDALHHTGQTSLIHLQGIKDINEIVQLRLKKICPAMQLTSQHADFYTTSNAPILPKQRLRGFYVSEVMRTVRGRDLLGNRWITGSL